MIVGFVDSIYGPHESPPLDVPHPSPASELEPFTISPPEIFGGSNTQFALRLSVFNNLTYDVDAYPIAICPGANVNTSAISHIIPTNSSGKFNMMFRTYSIPEGKYICTFCIDDGYGACRSDMPSKEILLEIIKK